MLLAATFLELSLGESNERTWDKDRKLKRYKMNVPTTSVFVIMKVRRCCELALSPVTTANAGRQESSFT